MSKYRALLSESQHSGQLANIIVSLDRWVQSHDWVGYDPYDLKAHPLYRCSLKHKATAWPAKAVVNLLPLTLRRLLRIRPQPHAKAMALFADAYLTLFDLTEKAEYRDLAEGRLAWLREHATSHFTGPAWGAPFDYQGRDFIPSNTPSVVITSIAARAFLYAFESLGNREYLDIAVGACRFLVADIPRYQPDADRICFSKMPGVDWYVHNANLMVAATLAMIGRAAGITEWTRLSRRAANYTLAEQREDGAWYYWGPPSPLLHWVDHYHTGFVLRALDDLLSTTGWSDLRPALDKGYIFYTNRLFDDAKPRLTEASLYPIDIHSCAEAILCLSQLARRYDDALPRAEAVARWTIDNMRHPDGYFYYRRYRWLTVKIPYMRWGQAWMMLALSRLQQVLTAEHSGGTDGV